MVNFNGVSLFPSQGEERKGAMRAQGKQVNVLWKSFPKVMVKFSKRIG